MFKETFWYPVNYAHISSADYSLIRSSFQQGRLLVSWLPGMQGRAEHQHSQLGSGAPWFESIMLHPNRAILLYPDPRACHSHCPLCCQTNCRIDPWRKPFPSCCWAEMIHSFSITQLRLAAKKPEFIEGTNSKPKLHLFLIVNQEQTKLRETTGLWLKPSSEIWRTGDSLTLLFFNFLP